MVTYFLFRSLRVSWHEIEQLDLARWRPQPVPLAGSFAILVAVFIYLVALWARLVRALGGPILRLPDAVTIFFLSNLGRYIPGKLWQLAGLVYLAGKRGVAVGVASSSAVLAQIFSVAAAVIVALIYFAAPHAAGEHRGLWPWALLVVALLLALISSPPVLRRALRWIYRLHGRPETAPTTRPSFGPRWLALHLPAWLGYGAAFGLLWSAFPALPPVAWSAAIGGFAAAYVLGYAAVFAPAGIGVREGAMAVLLAPWLGATPAAVFAVLARLWMTLGELMPLASTAARHAVQWLHGRKELGDHAR